MSPDGEVRCCLGCGRDTTAPDQLCSRCSNNRHTPRDESAVVAVIKVSDLAPSRSGRDSRNPHSATDGDHAPRRACPGAVEDPPAPFSEHRNSTLKGTA